MMVGGPGGRDLPLVEAPQAPDLERLPEVGRRSRARTRDGNAPDLERLPEVGRRSRARTRDGNAPDLERLIEGTAEELDRKVGEQRSCSATRSRRWSVLSTPRWPR